MGWFLLDQVIQSLNLKVYNNIGHDFRKQDIILENRGIEKEKKNPLIFDIKKLTLEEQFWQFLTKL